VCPKVYHKDRAKQQREMFTNKQSKAPACLVSVTKNETQNRGLLNFSPLLEKELFPPLVFCFVFFVFFVLFILTRGRL